jgi:hypothetical protein
MNNNIPEPFVLRFMTPEGVASVTAYEWYEGIEDDLASTPEVSE